MLKRSASKSIRRLSLAASRADAVAAEALRSRMTMLPSLIHNLAELDVPTLASEHRRLLMEGTLIRTQARSRKVKFSKKSETLHFFLFNDLLIYCKPAGAKERKAGFEYAYHGRLHLRDAAVSESPTSTMPREAVSPALIEEEVRQAMSSTGKGGEEEEEEGPPPELVAEVTAQLQAEADAIALACTFELVNKAKGNKLVLLRAETPQEADEWATALRSTIAKTLSGIEAQRGEYSEKRDKLAPMTVGEDADSKLVKELESRLLYAQQKTELADKRAAAAERKLQAEISEAHFGEARELPASLPSSNAATPPPGATNAETLSTLRAELEEAKEKAIKFEAAAQDLEEAALPELRKKLATAEANAHHYEVLSDYVSSQLKDIEHWGAAQVEEAKQEAQQAVEETEAEAAARIAALQQQLERAETARVEAEDRLVAVNLSRQRVASVNLSRDAVKDVAATQQAVDSVDSDDSDDEAAGPAEQSDEADEIAFLRAEVQKERSKAYAAANRAASASLSPSMVSAALRAAPAAPERTASDPSADADDATRKKKKKKGFRIGEVL